MDDLEPIFLLEAERLLEEGEARKAAELCTRGLAKYPDYTSAYLVLLRALESMDDTALMKEVYDDAPNIIKLKPSVQELVEKSGLTTEVTTKEPLTTALPQDEPQVEVSLEAEINRAIRDDELKQELLETLTQQVEATKEPTAEAKETLTLARIYEEQEAYAEALAIYKQLQEKSEDKSIYNDKIIELEAILEE
jgi:tetratricopeptide (TPR) repeat protein